MALSANERAQRYRLKHLNEVASKMQVYRRKNRFSLMRKRLAAKMVFSENQWDEIILKLLLGRCDSCGKPNASGRSLHVDHDHKTKQYRGVLCTGCNLALGCLHDNRDTVLALASYITNGGSNGV